MTTGRCNVEGLEHALAAVGLRGTIEVRGSLAVLRLQDDITLADTALRDCAVKLASDHGFTHLALELFDDDRAPVHRD
jgi:hypothetical protein